MEIKYIVGIDPSFTAAGVSIVDIDGLQISTTIIGVSAVGNKDFVNLALLANNHAHKIADYINNSTVTHNTCIGMENALPWGYSSAELMALDTILYNHLGPERVYAFNPTYLNFIMGKHTKKDSINLAKGLLSIFNSFGFEHISQFSKRLTDGEAESFIYAVRTFVRSFPDHIITKKILENFENFSENKERVCDGFIF